MRHIVIKIDKLKWIVWKNFEQTTIDTDSAEYYTNTPKVYINFE